MAVSKHVDNALIIMMECMILRDNVLIVKK